MRNCTVIIPHKSKDKDRIDNLNTILKWVNKLTFVEKVILVESDTKEQVKQYIDEVKNNFDYKLEHYFIYSEIFNRSWICNYGAKKTDSKYLFFLDNDIFVNSDTLNNNYDNISSVIKPYNKYLALSPKKSKSIRELATFDKSIYSNFSSNDITMTLTRITAGGMLIITANFFWKIGGWNESFKGWGYEDNEMYDRIKAKTTVKLIQTPVYHLFHKQEGLIGSNNNHNIYMNTLKNGPNHYINNIKKEDLGNDFNSNTNI